MFTRISEEYIILQRKYRLSLFKILYKDTESYDDAK